MVESRSNVLRVRCARALAASAAAIAGTPAAADEAAAGAPGIGRAVTDPLAAGSIVQMLLALAVVLAAIGTAAWLLRRFGRGRFGGPASMKLLGALSIGPRERVLLVQVGDQQVLLGVTPGSVRSLQLLSTPIAAEALGAVDRPHAEDAPFAQRLAQALAGQRPRT